LQFEFETAFTSPYKIRVYTKDFVMWLAMTVYPYRSPSYFWRVFLLSAFFFILGCAPVDKRGGISSAQARRLGGITVPTNFSMDLFEVP
jgi:hypothetical protein